MNNYKVDFTEIPWEAPIEGVRFKAYKQDGKQLRLVEFAQGFVEPDWCLKGHIGMILEGQMELDFDGKITLLNPGDGVFIPAGEEHKHKGRVISEAVKVILVEEA